MKIFSNFFFIIFYFTLITIDLTYSSRPILLIILYDGFRADYLYRGITPTLNHFRENGVHSDYLETEFPGATGPVQRTISMGRYANYRGHRMVFPKGLNLNIDMEKEDSWTKEYPIWILNNLNGGTSACMMWWQCENTWNNNTKIDPTLLQKYDNTWSLRSRADKIIEWLNVTDIKKRPNLVMFYVEELDRITHFFGPLSRNSSLMIRRLDLLTKYILTKLMEINLYHVTNIIITSDHGMRSVYQSGIIPPDKYKWKSTVLGPTPATALSSGAVARFSFFVPNDVNKFQQFQAEGFTYVEQFYRQGKISKYKLVRHPRLIYTVGSSYIMEMAAFPNYAFNITGWKKNEFMKYSKLYPTLLPPKERQGPYGVHGYFRQHDALFIAKGPMLARFKKITPFQQVDLFGAFAKLLRIPGNHERDGNFSRIVEIFPIRNPINWPEVLVYICGAAVMSSIAFHLLVEYLLIDWS